MTPPRTIVSCLLAALAVLCCVLWPARADAAVTCSVDTQGIAFGSASTATGTVAWACTNSDPAPTSFTLCLGIAPGLAMPPIMRNGDTALAFRLYADASGSTVWDDPNPLVAPVTVSGHSGRVSGWFPIYGEIAPEQTPVAGIYAARMEGSVLGVLSGGVCQEQEGAVRGQVFALDAMATIPADCHVTVAGPVDLGPLSGLATEGIAGSTTIAVTCTNNTPFTIGLTPSNGDTGGSGMLAGSDGNPDRQPYQLRSVNPVSGPVWGNIVASGNLGNGVAGRGTGKTLSFTAWVSIPSVRARPDTYTDTVTITVDF